MDSIRLSLSRKISNDVTDYVPFMNDSVVYVHKGIVFSLVDDYNQLQMNMLLLK